MFNVKEFAHCEKTPQRIITQLYHLSHNTTYTLPSVPVHVVYVNQKRFFLSPSVFNFTSEDLRLMKCVHMRGLKLIKANSDRNQQ